MIRIEKPFIEYDGNYAILNTFISIDKKEKNCGSKLTISLVNIYVTNEAMLTLLPYYIML